MKSQVIKKILIGLLLGAVTVSCSVDKDKQILSGNTFEKVYWDLIGSIDAKFEVNGWEHEKGDDLTISYDLKVDFDHLAKDNVKNLVKGVWVVWAGERMFDEDGRFHQMVNALMSTYLTTTGIPIENNQPMVPSKKIGHFYSSPFDFAEYFPIDQFNNAEGMHLVGSWTRKLDETVPTGYYRPMFDIFFDTEFFGPKQWATAPFLGMNNPQIFTSTTFHPKYFTQFLKTLYPKRFLPMVRVGKLKKEPRIPIVIFPEVHVNGNTGVVAEQDKDSFGLSSRYRFPNDLIMPPGERKIYPCYISNFPLSPGLTDIGGATLAQDEIEHYIDYSQGEVSATIITPDGKTHDLGTKKYLGRRFPNGGPKLEGGDYEFDFDQWGEYRVTMNAWVRDLLGRKINGGGDYTVFVGRWLTYSSTVKPGKNFKVGNFYPAKLEINPPFPAEVEITIDYYPYSDKDRKTTMVLEDRANNYGYYFPHEDKPTMVFEHPGEYRSDVRTKYISPDGTHWYGHQVSAGVILNENSRVGLGGMRSSDLGILIGKDENFGMRDRFEVGDESSMGVNFLDVADCYDVMSPYRTGDTLHIAATMSHFGNVDSYLSLNPKDPKLRHELYEKFFPTPLLTLFTTDQAMNRIDRMLRLTMLVDVTYIMRDDEKADMFPILMQNKYDYQPFNFPELNEVETYAYYSSLRPGFSAYVITTDSTAIGSYWSTSPNVYGHQFNAGVNGDMPGDIYLTMAGLVYKDHRAGKVDYAAYSSTIAVNPKETNNNRVMAPMEEPIMTVNGNEVWLAVAMGSQEILEIGDRISLGLLVLPSVPAEINQSLTWPDGERVEEVHGTANQIGAFQSKVFTLDKPGIYKVFTEAKHLGKTGRVFGSGDAVFNHYVVSPDHPQIMEIDLPPQAHYDVSKILQIPIKIKDGFSNVVIDYSVVTPGMIMDEDRFTPENGQYIYRFIPSQYAMQFPNFDITDFRKGTPLLNDPFFIIFFATATDSAGRTVHDVHKVMARLDQLYHFYPKQWQAGAEASKNEKGTEGGKPDADGAPKSTEPTPKVPG